MKSIYLAGSRSSGFWNWRKRSVGNRLLVLCYHSVISDDAPNDPRTNIAVTRSQFERQMSILRRKWTPISLADIASCLEKSAPLPKNAIHVTFDDGFRNNLTLAAPILQQYEIPATVFLTAGLIGTTKLLWSQEVEERHLALSIQMQKDAEIELQKKLQKELEEILEQKIKKKLQKLQLELPDVKSEEISPETISDFQPFSVKSLGELKRISQLERMAYIDQLRQTTTLSIDSKWQQELYEFLNWDEVRNLHQMGISIGAHSMTHPILTSLDSTSLHQELSKSKTRIERELGESCLAIAYPNGSQHDVNKLVVQECLQLGFCFGFNLFERRNPPVSEMNPMSIDRICITRDLSHLEFEHRLLVL
ncbi:MAG: polysaccharide deacetylase family protein [Thermoguttaceae bacterium]